MHFGFVYRYISCFFVFGGGDVGLVLAVLKPFLSQCSLICWQFCDISCPKNANVIHIFCWWVFSLARSRFITVLFCSIFMDVYFVVALL
jgi:hypothetical protein